MNKQEILTKAIQQAVDNGFDAKIDGDWVVCKNLHARLDGPAPKDIIYDHNFAKALWGEEGGGLSQGGTGKLGWQYHLQKMVVSPDPIAYLAQHTTGSASLSQGQGQESP